MLHSIFQFCSENFETVATIIGSVVTGASAICALVPGSGWVKNILNILALNVRNAKPEQVDKAKKIIDTIAVATAPNEKEK